ncbi:hypothetical protein ACFY2M_19370 [Streptomyces sp. NPDC001276]|uniref:hypothetical protein n=1 Tax=Streptomyces sp. NPDC001276 TaxID=3364555 RepID=UPI0036C648D7
MGWFKSNDSDNDGYVVTTKADGGADTVIVTASGVNVHHCPGGITEDDVVD